MATATGVEAVDSTQLLELDFLTEEERAIIERVLKADDDLRTSDRIRLGTMRQDIEQDRQHQKEQLSKKQCACCETPFGWLFNTGANCPECCNRVCKRCRRKPQQPPPSFFCNVCTKNRLLDLQSMDYMPFLRGTPEPPPLYGTELIWKSLETIPSRGKRRQMPSPGHRPTPPAQRISTSSAASSIVVKYVAEGKEHSPSPEASALARKLSPSELSESEGEEEEEDENTAKLAVPSGSFQVLKRSDSGGSLVSMTSVYSAACEKGEYEISGEILMGVWYRPEDQQLYVRITKAKGLAVAKKAGFSDPYVKTYLLPDRTKHSKRKTSVQRKTINPEFNETLKYKIPQVELKSRILWVSVWDWDRFGRNQFMGEVRFPLSSRDFTNSKDSWYPLQEKDDSVHILDTFYRGELCLGLMFTPNEPVKGRPRRKKRGTLHIHIKEAKELPIMDSHGLTDAAVKCYLLPNRGSSVKKKTNVIKNSLNPVWDEKFTYNNVAIENLSKKRVLEVTVWDYDRRGSHDFIGGLRLGPPPGQTGMHEWMDSIGDEVSHWEAMLSRPGEWVEQWHTLRPTVDPLSKTKQPAKPARTEKLSPVMETSPTPSEELPTMYPTSPPPVASPTEQLLPLPTSDTSNLKRLKHSETFGSQVSLYSLAGGGGKGDYPITGEVQVGVFYSGGQLNVQVSQARGLAAADSNGLSDPYVKTYLLPDKSKHTKRKTTVRRRTIDPVYDETLMYKVAKSELSSRTLWLSVWDWDQFGHNDFLGEIHLPLSSCDLADSTCLWYTLKEKDEEESKDAFYRGDLLVGLMFNPTDFKKGKTKGTLSIAFKQARDLPKMDAQGLSDGFVKCYLLPDRTSKGKRKTRIIKNSLNPVWEETFTYEKVAQEDLSTERVLQVTVWDYDFGTSNDFIGGLRLGPLPGQTVKRKKWMDSIGDEVSHWEAMLSRPGEWVEQWHTLRPTMDPIDVDRSSAHPYTPAESFPSTLVESLPQTASKEPKPAEEKVVETKVAEEKMVEAKVAEEKMVEAKVAEEKQAKVVEEKQAKVATSTPVRGTEATFDEEEFFAPLPRSSRVITKPVSPRPRKVKSPNPPETVKPRSTSPEPPSHTPSLPLKSEPLRQHTPPPGPKGASVAAPQLKGHTPPPGPKGASVAAPQLKGHTSPQHKPEDEFRKVSPHTSPPRKPEDEFRKVSPHTSPQRKPEDKFRKATAYPTPQRKPEDEFRKATAYPTPQRKPEDEFRKATAYPTPPVKEKHAESPIASVRTPAVHVTPNYSSRSSPVPKQAKDVRLQAEPPVVPAVHKSSPGRSPVHVTPNYSSTSQPVPKQAKDVRLQAEPPVVPAVHKSSPGRSPVHVTPNYSSTSQPVPKQPESPVVPAVHKSSPERLHKEEEHMAPTPVNTNLLSLKAHSDSAASFGSLTSVYSAAGGGKGDYDITGEVQMGVFYKNGQLNVHVSQARGLAAVDSNGLSDPYVKTYLLPDKSKHSKRKTTIKRKTLDPVYDETLKYKLSQTELSSRILWVSVWDWDRFGRNQFLGEVRLPLSSHSFTDSRDYWYTLSDRDEDLEGPTDTYRGQLNVALMFSPTESKKKGKAKGTLNLVIKKARDLPIMDAKGLTDSFVKCYLLPDKSSSGKKKTNVLKNNLNPVWEERFSYEKVVQEELSTERVLEMTIWDFNKGSSNDFIGGLRLGPPPGRTVKHKEWMDSIGDEVSHWEAMLSRPGEWVEQWHTLRTTMDPRSVSVV